MEDSLDFIKEQRFTHQTGLSLIVHVVDSTVGQSSKGMVFTLVRDIPAYAAFFGSYSVIKERVDEKSQFKFKVQ